MSRLCLFTVCLMVLVLKRFAEGSVCSHHCVHNGKCNSKHIHDTCYYLFKDLQRTWSDSKHHCEKQNLSIGQIQKGLDTDGLFHEQAKSIFAWQGGKIKYLNQLQFVNDIPFNGTRQHFSNDSRICGTYIQRQPQQAKYCNEKHKYICHFDQYNLTTSQGKQSWFDARSACLDQGGDLFYLNINETLTDGNTLGGHLKGLPVNETFYIGVRNFKWLWLDGSEIENYNWKSTEPGNKKEDCIVIQSSNNTWQDWPCNSTHYTICQKAIKEEEEMATTGKMTFTSSGVDANKFPGPSSQKVIPWILFGISLLIIGSLVAYVIILKQKKTDDTLEMCDNPYYDSNSSVTISTAAGMAGDMDRNQAVRSKTGNNAADDMEIVDNEYYGSFEAFGVTNAQSRAEKPAFKVVPQLEISILKYRETKLEYVEGDM